MRRATVLVLGLAAGCGAGQPAVRPGDAVQLVDGCAMAKDPDPVVRYERWKDATKGKQADDVKPFDDPRGEIVGLGPGTTLRVLKREDGVWKVIVLKDVRDPDFVASVKILRGDRPSRFDVTQDLKDAVGYVPASARVVAAPNPPAPPN